MSGCTLCGKEWVNGDCESTVSRRALCRRNRLLRDGLKALIKAEKYYNHSDQGEGPAPAEPMLADAVPDDLVHWLRGPVRVATNLAVKVDQQKAEIARLKAEIARLRAERERLHRERDERLARIDQLEIGNERLAESVVEAVHERIEAMATVDRQLAEIRSRDQDVAELIVERDRARGEAAEARAERDLLVVSHRRLQAAEAVCTKLAAPRTPTTMDETFALLDRWLEIVCPDDGR